MFYCACCRASILFFPVAIVAVFEIVQCCSTCCSNIHHAITASLVAQVWKKRTLCTLPIPLNLTIECAAITILRVAIIAFLDRTFHHPPITAHIGCWRHLNSSCCYGSSYYSFWRAARKLGRLRKELILTFTRDAIFTNSSFFYTCLAFRTIETLRSPLQSIIGQPHPGSTCPRSSRCAAVEADAGIERP